MDKNSIIGILIIGSILIGWMLMTQPSKEQLAKQQFSHDSIAKFEETSQKQLAQKAKLAHVLDTQPAVILNDSTKNYVQKSIYGNFIDAAAGDNKLIVLENKVMKVNISSKGGRIASVQLKEYKTYDGKPLILFQADSSIQNITFATNSKSFSTDSLYFVSENNQDSKNIAMRLYAGNKSKYIEYVYSLTDDDYMMTSRINIVGLQDIIAPTANGVTFNWQMATPSQEQNKETQQHASTIYYKYVNDDVDKISESKEEKIVLEKPVKWIGFKQQFFTSVIIADNSFDKNGEIESVKDKNSIHYIKNYSASLIIPYKHQNIESFGLRYYFGPNHYKTLKKYNIELERQINLGWKIFGWVNRFAVIPIFNFLSGFNLNYGIIILILTLLIKLALLPIAYRTVLSSAKMRVLKPEIDEITEKYKNEDPMKKQQATMALYKQAGVNPMAGCIPVVLQMPILIALFSFFPASIELRQQGFLWAHDLSTYDSVYNFGFSIPWYGDHVSLFALLMTGSTLLYTWSNSQLMGTSNQMPGMKWMMYLMPIVFLGFLNNYSAGLSWYYFLANMITFAQTWIIQKFVIDQDALHKKIQANKKKPVKASKFQQRLEQMAKERQQIAPKKK
ncbi:MAG: membrane protein insertase YidC [Bacteroidia bacterium]